MGFQEGLSGLNAASKSLNVIGHNIANANTIGMKASRAEFSELYASSIGIAGGVSSGIGVEVGTVSQQFTQGNITVTGNSLDVAINGNGFFQVQMPNGVTAYTRSGQFKIDKNNNIVTNDGSKLQGLKADPVTGQVLTGSTIGPLVLPSGGEIPAKATSAISATLNLDARAAIATGGPPPAALIPPLETYGTSVVAYDGQGLEVPVNMYFVKTATNKWDVYTKDLTQATTDDVKLASLEFDPANGKLLTTGGITAGTGATLSGNLLTLTGMASPNGTFATLPTLDLSTLTQNGSNFSVGNLTQDGQTSGKLTSITIDESGVVLGTYSNGAQKAAGQIELVNFTNVNGLSPIGAGNWLRTPTSGDPSTRGVPGTGNLGSLRSGALEESNVDLTAELVNMMTAQRSYQANAQTVKTQDQVLQTLVSMR